MVSGKNLVRAYQSFIIENHLCIVMEFMQGRDLRTALDELGCFDEAVARFYFAELVSGLESLHAINIVH